MAARRMLATTRPAVRSGLLAAAAFAAVALCGSGCGVNDSEQGEVSLESVPLLVNYDSVGFSWSTTYEDSITLRYRLNIADNDTQKTENVVTGSRIPLPLSSQSLQWQITGFAAEKAYYMWVTAYRMEPGFTVVGESERVSVTTCSSPYGLVSKEPKRTTGLRAISHGAKAYVVWPDKVFDRYDPATKLWARLPDVPRPHADFGLAAVAGKIYVIGGAQSNDIDAFDTASNTWETRAAIPGTVSVRTAVALGNTIYTFATTGQIDESANWADYPTARQTMAYDPVAETWTRVADRPGGEVMGPVVGAAGKVYMFGSYTAGTTDYIFEKLGTMDSVYAFDPAVGAWGPVGLVFDQRAGFHATEGADGIYLIGGVVYREHAPTVWSIPPTLVFDPPGGTWRVRTLPAAPLDFGGNGALVNIGPTMYFINGGNRWPGIMGTYTPNDDACGVDVNTWDDTTPYGIDYTAAAKASGTSARASSFRISRAGRRLRPTTLRRSRTRRYRPRGSRLRCASEART